MKERSKTQASTNFQNSPCTSATVTTAPTVACSPMAMSSSVSRIGDHRVPTFVVNRRSLRPSGARRSRQFASGCATRQSTEPCVLRTLAARPKIGRQMGWGCLAKLGNRAVRISRAHPDQPAPLRSWAICTGPARRRPRTPTGCRARNHSGRPDCYENVA